MSDDGRVRLGPRVRVEDGAYEDEWTIVTAYEADLAEGRISEDSPMAKALLGHRVGDQVQVRRPTGCGAVVIAHVD